MKAWELWETNWSTDSIKALWEFSLKSGAWRENPRYAFTVNLINQYAKSVLDIGCGGGMLYKTIYESNPAIKYVGIDITPKMLNSARGLFPEADFREMDAAELVFEDNEFDACVIAHVLEHHPIEHGEKMLREALRVARKLIILIFFVRPISYDKTSIIIQKQDAFYVNSYNHFWLTDKIHEILDGRGRIDYYGHEWKNEYNTFYVISKI
jgi:ubiquinone/menaquinone biosynthesis C-methylase UbiE